MSIDPFAMITVVGSRDTSSGVTSILLVMCMEAPESTKQSSFVSVDGRGRCDSPFHFRWEECIFVLQVSSASYVQLFWPIAFFFASSSAHNGQFGSLSVKVGRVGAAMMWNTTLLDDSQRWSHLFSEVDELFCGFCASLTEMCPRKYVNISKLEN